MVLLVFPLYILDYKAVHVKKKKKKSKPEKKEKDDGLGCDLG